MLFGAQIYSAIETKLVQLQYQQNDVLRHHQFTTFAKDWHQLKSIDTQIRNNTLPLLFIVTEQQFQQNGHHRNGKTITQPLLKKEDQTEKIFGCNYNPLCACFFTIFLFYPCFVPCL